MSNRIPVKMKTKIYKIYIIPILLYSLECVTWTKKLSQMIETFQNNIMRMIRGYCLTDKIKISTLRNLTSLCPLFYRVKSKSPKWYGHVKRSSLGLAKQCLEGLIQGKRSRPKGKPRNRCYFLIWSPCNDWSSLILLIQDRKRWRTISHVDSQSA